jgi:hypothetical protein
VQHFTSLCTSTRVCSYCLCKQVCICGHESSRACVQRQKAAEMSGTPPGPLSSSKVVLEGFTPLRKVRLGQGGRGAEVCVHVWGRVERKRLSVDMSLERLALFVVAVLYVGGRVYVFTLTQLNTYMHKYAHVCKLHRRHTCTLRNPVPRRLRAQHMTTPGSEQTEGKRMSFYKNAVDAPKEEWDQPPWRMLTRMSSFCGSGKYHY